MSDFKKLFGQRVKKLREQRNFTQEYLAEKVGIEQATLSNIERGKSHPTVDTLEKLAIALDVEVYLFFKFDEKLSLENKIKEVTGAMRSDEMLAGLLYKFFLSVR